MNGDHDFRPAFQRLMAIHDGRPAPPRTVPPRPTHRRDRAAVNRRRRVLNALTRITRRTR